MILSRCLVALRLVGAASTLYSCTVESGQDGPPVVADTGQPDGDSGGAETGSQDTGAEEDSAAEACVHEPAEREAAIDYRTVGQYVWRGEGVDFDWYKITSPSAVATTPGRPAVLQVYPVSDSVESSVALLDAYLELVDLASFDYLVLGEENIWWSSTPEILDALYERAKAHPGAPPVLQWFSPPQGSPITSIGADGWVVDNYGMSGPDLRRVAMKHVVTGKPLFLCIWASNYGGYALEIDGSQEQVDVAAELNLPMLFFSVAGPYGSTGTWWSDTDPETSAWRDWYTEVRAAANATDTTRLPGASANRVEGQVVDMSGGDDDRYSWTDGFSGTEFLDQAAIDGFLNLRWSPDTSQLRVEPREGVVNAGCGSSLTWSRTSETDVTQAVARLAGSLDANTSVVLALSVDGESWIEASADAAGPFDLRVTGPEGASRALYVRVEATVPVGGDASVTLDEVGLEASVAAPDPTVVLDPGSGEDTWTEDFTTDGYLARAELVNPDEIEWSGTQVYMGSLSGYSNAASLTWTFESVEPLSGISAAIGSMYASCPHWASANSVSILDSDGVALATEGSCALDSGTYTGPLVATVVPPAGTTSFKVRYEMVSASGVANDYTNMLDDLSVVVSGDGAGP